MENVLICRPETEELERRSGTLRRTRVLGQKAYEMKDHLGNIRATVSDRKLSTLNASNQPCNFRPLLLTATNYYAGGMLQPGRNYNAGRRYSYNGKPDENEVPGWQDYGFREYDRRINRFISVDPLTKDYPWYTPYQFAGNMPIKFIDLDGLEPLDPVEKWRYVGNPVKFTDKQIANLVECSVNKEQYWVVKQGKGYIYTDKDGKQPWAPFHAYTEREIGNAYASAGGALADVFAKSFAGTMTAMAFAPALASVQVSTSLWGLKAAFSAGSQALINKKVDVWDTGLDIIASPGAGSSIGNGLVDVNVYFEKNRNIELRVAGFNKSFKEFLIDATISFGAGKISSSASEAFPKTKSTLEEALYESVISLPTNTIEKGANQVINNKTKK